MSDEFKIDSEAVMAVINRLALECHKSELARGITDKSVDLYLPLVCDIFLNNSDDFLKVVPVAASGTSDVLTLSITFDPIVYRRMAEAAKNRAARTLD